MKNFTAEFVKSATGFSHYPDETYPDVAFAGRSNVGKSSLINALLGRKRLARTSGTPGRTQQINFFLVGKEVYFVDLPGYGFARVPLAVKKQWGPMVEEYLRGRKNLRLVIVILDIRREPSTEDINLIDWLDHYGIPHLLVLTKTDKLSKSSAMKRRREISEFLKVVPEMLHFFSAKTGQGREALIKTVFGQLKD